MGAGGIQSGIGGAQASWISRFQGGRCRRSRIGLLAQAQAQAQPPQAKGPAGSPLPAIPRAPWIPSDQFEQNVLGIPARTKDQFGKQAPPDLTELRKRGLGGVVEALSGTDMSRVSPQQVALIFRNLSDTGLGQNELKDALVRAYVSSTRELGDEGKYKVVDVYNSGEVGDVPSPALSRAMIPTIGKRSLALQDPQGNELRGTENAGLFGLGEVLSGTQKLFPAASSSSFAAARKRRQAQTMLLDYVMQQQGKKGGGQ